MVSFPKVTKCTLYSYPPAATDSVESGYQKASLALFSLRRLLRFRNRIRPSDAPVSFHHSPDREEDPEDVEKYKIQPSFHC